jgi:hypothetical protein
LVDIGVLKDFLESLVDGIEVCHWI